MKWPPPPKWAGAWSSKLLCGLTLLYSSFQRWRVRWASSRSMNQCVAREKNRLDTLLRVLTRPEEAVPTVVEGS